MQIPRQQQASGITRHPARRGAASGIGAIAALLLLLLVAAPAFGDLRLGVIDFTPSANDAELDAAAGAPVRLAIAWCSVQDPWDPIENPSDPRVTPSCAWENHERGQGACTVRNFTWDDYNWDVIDQRLLNLWSNGVEAEHVILQDAPQCAGRANCEYQPGKDEQDDCSPANSTIDNWRDFVVRAARRYGPQGYFWDNEGIEDPKYDIHHWDVWNEANLGPKWNGNPSVPQYADVLKKAHAALHQVADARGASIWSVAGNVGYNSLGGSGYEFLRDLYKSPTNGGQGAKQFSDRAAFHPFRSSGPNAIENRAEEVAGIPNIPLLAITAMGWSVNRPATIDKCVPTEDEQAQKLAASFDRLANQVPEVRWVIWFNSIDQEPEHEPEDDEDYDPTNDVPCEPEGGIRRERFGLWAIGSDGVPRDKPALCEFERRAPIMTSGQGGRNATLCP